MQNSRAKENRPSLALLSMFLLFTLIMGIVESRIPFEFVVPGVKLGLANVVVLTSLYLFPIHDTLKIVVLKCVITAIAAGNALSFLYSISGALLSFFIMALLVRLFGNKISTIGVSVVGAVAHNFGQILMASAIMRTFVVVSYLPVLIISGIITGILVGIAAKYTISLTAILSRYTYKIPNQTQIFSNEKEERKNDTL